MGVKKGPIVKGLSLSVVVVFLSNVEREWEGGKGT